jgi:cytochrome c oxidase subunit 2
MSDHPFWEDLPLWPAQASTAASRVDALFLFLVALTIFFSVLIAGLLVSFALKYRSRGGATKAVPIEGSTKLELLWSIIPLVIVMFTFAWGADIFVSLKRPPDDTMDVHVIGKQWMWKLQHPSGRSEINELHVPVGRPVRLIMTSQDVIHSFFVPAFRIKQDVLPGRYTTVWFEATKPGKYHLFCTEYCGTKHAEMGGWVYVMEPAAFQEWLGGGPALSMASAGERLFLNLGCVTCHSETATSRGPSLQNLLGSEVKMTDGSTVTADETYIRESIVNPGAKLVDGYGRIMPTFRGLVNEEGMLQILEYIKTLTDENEGEGGAASHGAAATEEPAS